MARKVDTCGQKYQLAIFCQFFGALKLVPAGEVNVQQFGTIDA